MKSRVRILMPLLLVVAGFYSCVITDQIGVLNMEIMKPGIFAIPEHYDTIAIIKRDFCRSDTCMMFYYNLRGLRADTSIKFRDLSNNCTDGLAKYFEEDGYFQKVNNYQDSLNYLFKAGPEGKIDPNKLFEKTKSDICIFLDYFHLNNTVVYDYEKPFWTQASLLWSVAFKNDTTSYIYNQTDTLFFDQDQYENFRLMNEHSKEQYLNAAEYLGRFFGTKIIPSWLTVERLYYRSNNPEMLKAEKFAKNNEWLKAAEIWNRETKNKNRMLATKACFNMALACEMEGKPDVGISWLVKSYSGLKREDQDHKINCQRYVNILATRKIEIERLDHQVRNAAYITKN
jgi:hypothetical protein